ncbi:hypothetical protein BJ508DRAFT_360611 [Ascobolus immersus RN42]|uniref:Uncharacterized protein n=1 Tax=Ascobolus immersus RN42 TaxID=1160509 RepID=A0A3N4IGW8_ASCIM|nr:hypothetical protein BJ508DRAFT_360611 [Ascobolus immersus RN42]
MTERLSSTTTASSSSDSTTANCPVTYITLGPGKSLVPFCYMLALRDKASFEPVIDEIVRNGGTLLHVVPYALWLSCELTSELEEKLKSGKLECSHLLVRISQDYEWEDGLDEGGEDRFFD